MIFVDRFKGITFRLLYFTELWYREKVTNSTSRKGSLQRTGVNLGEHKGTLIRT